MFSMNLCPLFNTSGAKEQFLEEQLQTYFIIEGDRELRVYSTKLSCSMQKFCIIFKGIAAILLSLGSFLNIFLNAPIIISITNSFSSFIACLLSKSGFPNNHTLILRITEMSFFINKQRTPSTKTCQSLIDNILWLILRFQYRKSSMFLFTRVFSSSKHARMVFIIRLLLFGKLFSSELSFIWNSMYFKFSRIWGGCINLNSFFQERFCRVFVEGDYFLSCVFCVFRIVTVC